MDILVLSNMYPSKKYPAYGTFVENFIIGLKTNNVSNIKLVTIKKTNFFYIKIYNYIIYFIKSLIAIKGLKRKSIIYIHFPTYSILPLFFTKLDRCKIVLNFHGEDLCPTHFISKFLYEIAKFKMKRADLIVVPSNYFKSVLISKNLVESSRIFISPSGGINLSKFRPKNINYFNKSFRIGFLSRIDKGKGWEIFLQVLLNLLFSKINFVGKLGGSGKEFKLLLEKIDELQLKSHLEITGAIPYDAVPSFFKDLDLFIFPSSRKGESLGLVVLEALASGIPVIAKQNGAINEIIKDGYNGYIYKNNEDIDTISKLILKYYNLNLNEKIKMKKRALLSIQNYEATLVSEQLLTKLKSL